MLKNTASCCSLYKKIISKNIAKFIPVTYLLIALAVANISMCMVSTMGLFAITGITLNNVATIVPPLVMAPALCDTVHIFSYIEKRVLSQFPDKRKALVSVLNKVVREFTHNILPK